MCGITDNLTLLLSANYRISVVGTLDESISDRLGGLAIQNQRTDQDSRKPVGSLTGQLADQAALFGVLNALFNMRLPLIAVEYLVE